MKVLKLVLLLAIIGVVFSCGDNLKKKETTNSEISQNTDLKNVELDENNDEIASNFEKVSLKIDGMTCEIGCAKIIESKLSKTNGVKLAAVNFEEKRGEVEFDTNKVSENQIVKIIEKIAGGDLYKVKEVKKIR